MTISRHLASGGGDGGREASWVHAGRYSKIDSGKDERRGGHLQENVTVGKGTKN